jgi:Na+/melibiose symporter-like transporter
MVWGLISAALYAGYRIDKKYHAKIQETLAKRRAQAALEEPGKGDADSRPSQVT